MRDLLKVNVAIFLSIMASSVIGVLYQLYWSLQCDPKFGCSGVAYILIVIAFILYVASAISVSVAYYLYKHRKNKKITNAELVLIFIGLLIVGCISYKAVFISELIGVFSFFLGLIAYSFIVGMISFRGINEKYS